jgi:hypothetical protein
MSDGLLRSILPAERRGRTPMRRGPMAASLKRTSPLPANRGPRSRSRPRRTMPARRMPNLKPSTRGHRPPTPSPSLGRQRGASRPNQKCTPDHSPNRKRRLCMRSPDPNRKRSPRRFTPSQNLDPRPNTGPGRSRRRPASIVAAPNGAAANAPRRARANAAADGAARTASERSRRT